MLPLISEDQLEQLNMLQPSSEEAVPPAPPDAPPIGPQKKTFKSVAEKYATPEGRAKLEEMAGQVADYYKIPQHIFKGLLAHESEWNPLAKNPKSSAAGLGQFINSTAEGYFKGQGTLDHGPDDPRWHPGKNMDAAARLLRDNYKQYGDWDTAINHYGENTPAYLDKVKASIARYEGEPGKTSGIGGNAWSGAKESLGRSVGKLAAASDVVSDVHGPAVTELPPVAGREETIAQMTPKYTPPTTTAESYARSAGQAVGALPELGALSAATAPLLAPLAPVAPLTTSVLSNALPFMAQTATEPEAGIRQVGAAGGAGAGLGLIHNLPWYLRVPAAGMIGMGQAAAGSPEAPQPEDMVKSGVLMSLFSALTGGRAAPTTARPEIGGASTRLEDLLRRTSQERQKQINEAFPGSVNDVFERNQAIIDATPLPGEEPGLKQAEISQPPIGPPQGETLEIRDLDRRIASKYGEYNTPTPEDAMLDEWMRRPGAPPTPEANMLDEWMRRPEAAQEVAPESTIPPEAPATPEAPKNWYDQLSEEVDAGLSPDQKAAVAEVMGPEKAAQAKTPAAPAQPVITPESSPDPPAGNPYLIGEHYDSRLGITHQFSAIPDPEINGGFRVLRQDYQGGKLVQQFSVASGTQPEITRFLQTTQDPRWVNASKFGLGFEAAQQGKPGGTTFSLSSGLNAEIVKDAYDSTIKPAVNALKSALGGAEGEKAGFSNWLDSAKDLNRIIPRLPFWVAKSFPEFRAPEVTDMRIETSNTLKNNWLREVKPFFADMPIDRVRLVEQRLLEGDQIGFGRGGMTAEQMKQAILSHRARIQADGPEIYAAYMSVRTTLDNVWDRLEESYAQAGVAKSDVAKMRQQMGYQPEYFPHSWEQGKYYIIATDKDGNTIYRTMANNRGQGDRVFDDLEAKYGKGNVKAGKNVGLPDELFFGLTPEAAAKVADAAVGRLKGVAAIDKDQLHQAIADTFKARGFGQKFIARQNVGGYQTEGLREVLVNYLSGAAGYISKMEATPEYMRSLSELDAGQKPNLYKYARKYVQDALANSSEFDQTMGTWRGIMFHKYLGASLRSAAVNLTQNWTAFAPWMAKEGMSMPEIKVGVGLKDVLSDWGAFRGLLKGEPAAFTNLKPEENMALTRIFQSGALSDYQTQEMAGQLYGRAWGMLRKAAEASRWLFGTAESLNRTGSALTAFRYYSGEKGLDFETAVRRSNDAVMSSHYLMGKYNLPEIARGGTAQSVFRGSGYQFKGFTHNYLEMVNNLFRESPAAAIRAMVNLSLLAGPLAMPIVGEAYNVYKAMTGTDPVMDGFQNKEENPAYIFIKYGLPGFLETDIAGSMAAQVVRPDTPEAMVTNLVFGPLGSVLTQEIPQAHNLYQRGAGWRSAEPVAPVAVKNLLKARRESTEGVTTTRGQALAGPDGEPVKLTEREAIQQGAGFRPTSSSIRLDEQENLIRRQRDRQETQDRLASQYLRAVRESDDATMTRVLQDAYKYNEWSMKRGEPAIDVIKTVKERLAPKTTPKSWVPYQNAVE